MTRPPLSILNIVGWLLSSVLIGSLAAKTGKYLGAPIEARLLAFVITTIVILAIGYVASQPEAKSKE